MGTDKELALGGQVDAALFLRLSDALKDGFRRVAEAPVSRERKLRWQRRLIAVTTTARHDLKGALEQYERFEQDLDRELS